MAHVLEREFGEESAGTAPSGSRAGAPRRAARRDWRWSHQLLARSHAPDLASLPLAEKRRFLRHVRPYWEVHRHRAAPEVAQFVSGGEMSAGQLELHAGRVEDYREIEAKVEITYRERKSGKALCLLVDGRQLHRARDRLRATARPIAGLALATGLARPDPLFLGLDTTIEGTYWAGWKHVCLPLCDWRRPKGKFVGEHGGAGNPRPGLPTRSISGKRSAFNPSQQPRCEALARHSSSLVNKNAWGRTSCPPPLGLGLKSRRRVSDGKLLKSISQPGFRRIRLKIKNQIKIKSKIKTNTNPKAADRSVRPTLSGPNRPLGSVAAYTWINAELPIRAHVPSQILQPRLLL